MSGLRYTLRDLQHRWRQYRCSVLQARVRLEEIRDLIDSLLDMDSDVDRIATMKKLKRRLAWGYANIEDLAAISKVVNHGPFDWKAEVDAEKARIAAKPLFPPVDPPRP